MTVSEKFVITSTEQLRLCCIKNRFFTNGTNEQYENVFWANQREDRFTFDQIAAMIWICSDKSFEWVRMILLEEKEKWDSIFERYI